MKQIQFTEYTFKQVKRHLRRWFLVIFRPFYVMESLSQRRGQCNHCGCCPQCKYQKGNDCLKWKNLPFICKLYPIDEEDKNEISKTERCFYWGK